LSAFEADLVKAARPGLLAFVAAPGCLAESAANAAANAFFRMFGARSRFDLVQTHLGLALHQVTYLVDHAAHRRGIFPFNGVVDAPQAKPAHRGPMAFPRADYTAYQCDLERLAGFLRR